MNIELTVEKVKSATDEFLQNYSGAKATKAILGDENGEGGFVNRLKSAIRMGGITLNCSTARTRRKHAAEFDADYFEKGF